MNNNRNNRRRGRGNRNQGGGGNQLNRIDSRARGNAPQLLDKYKKLAQDAQHNGDRVQTEYYLQFADHYFRVIADNKARQDEARAKRGDGRNDGRADNRNDNRGDSRDQANDDGDEANERDNRRGDAKRSNRRPRARREDNDSPSENPVEGEVGVEGEAVSTDVDEAKPKRRGRKPKVEATGEDDAKPRRKPRASTRKKDADADGEIDSSVLPPAIKPEDRDSDDLEAVG